MPAAQGARRHERECAVRLAALIARRKTRDLAEAIPDRTTGAPWCAPVAGMSDCWRAATSRTSRRARSDWGGSSCSSATRADPRSQAAWTVPISMIVLDGPTKIGGGHADAQGLAGDAEPAAHAGRAADRPSPRRPRPWRRAERRQRFPEANAAAADAVALASADPSGGPVPRSPEPVAYEAAAARAGLGQPRDAVVAWPSSIWGVAEGHRHAGVREPPRRPSSGAIVAGRSHQRLVVRVRDAGIVGPARKTRDETRSSGARPGNWSKKPAAVTRSPRSAGRRSVAVERVRHLVARAYRARDDGRRDEADGGELFRRSRSRSARTARRMRGRQRDHDGGGTQRLAGLGVTSQPGSRRRARGTGDDAHTRGRAAARPGASTSSGSPPASDTNAENRGRLGAAGTAHEAAVLRSASTSLGNVDWTDSRSVSPRVDAAQQRDRRVAPTLRAPAGADEARRSARVVRGGSSSHEGSQTRRSLPGQEKRPAPPHRPSASAPRAPCPPASDEGAAPSDVDGACAGWGGSTTRPTRGPARARARCRRASWPAWRRDRRARAGSRPRARCGRRRPSDPSPPAARTAGRALERERGRQPGHAAAPPTPAARQPLARVTRRRWTRHVLAQPPRARARPACRAGCRGRG